MINVVGLGYIGLPTALMFAAHGVEVVGTDYNKDLVDTLMKGKTTFEEDGLDELFQEAVRGGIRFSHEYQKTDMYIVAVPTPYDKDSKKVDASYVAGAVSAPLLNTVFYMGLMCLIFYNCDYVQNLVASTGAANPILLVLAVVGVQGVIEVLVCGVIGTIISKAVDTALGRRKAVQASGKPAEMPVQDKTAAN